MRFLLDQGIPRSTLDGLSGYGHESIHVGDIGMAKSSDREILEEAILRKATILTFDSDFHTILAFLGSTEVSVIRIRIEGLKGAQIARLVHEVLVSCEPDIAQGAAVTVTERGIRLRRLPLV